MPWFPERRSPSGVLRGSAIGFLQVAQRATRPCDDPSVRGSAKPKLPLFRLDIALSLRLDLTAPGPAAAPASSFEVREIARNEIGPVLGDFPALYRPADQVDRVAPSGWRCFVAFEGQRPVRVSFVELRPNRPLMFGGVTDPPARGRGAFQSTVTFVIARLREAGETSLYSSTGRGNRSSVRAHQKAGFQVFRRTVDIVVFGVSLRGVARRLVRRPTSGSRPPPNLR